MFQPPKRDKLSKQLWKVTNDKKHTHSGITVQRNVPFLPVGGTKTHS